MNVTAFASAAELRRWFEKHHDSAAELWIGFARKDSGRPSGTYPQALDEALCFGWIDGVRKKVDDTTYTIRFTPRRRRSRWSLVNIRHFARLKKSGRVRPAGEKAFAARDPKKSGASSFEQRPQNLPPHLEQSFRANAAAWAFWQRQPPGYRCTAIGWVVSAAKAATQARRLARLMVASEAGKRLH